MNKLKLMTLFSGYDSQCLAMERLKKNIKDFDYDLVAWCEIDKYAIEAHNAIFPQYKDRNLGDITSVNYDEIPDCDVVTWSFPCTDISTAGRQVGLEQGSGTRSSLGWNAIDIFRHKRPKYLVMENVKALVSDKFIDSFNKMIRELERIGYSNYFKVLNAKDYGIPQNRERVFMVSILNEEDVDDWNNPIPEFYFPSPIKLDKHVSDFIMDDFPDEYFLNKTQIKKFMETYDDDLMYVKKYDIIKVGNYAPAGHNATVVISINGISPTVMENHGVAYSVIYETNGDRWNVKIDDKHYILRRFTQREFFRLMDVDDCYIDMIQSADIPKSQQYKLAGNSIVVNCLYYIFKEMLNL